MNEKEDASEDIRSTDRGISIDTLALDFRSAETNSHTHWILLHAGIGTIIWFWWPFVCVEALWSVTYYGPFDIEDNLEEGGLGFSGVYGEQQSSTAKPEWMSIYILLCLLGICRQAGQIDSLLHGSYKWVWWDEKLYDACWSTVRMFYWVRRHGDLFRKSCQIDQQVHSVNEI
jgi:hypothetical protein